MGSYTPKANVPVKWFLPESKAAIMQEFRTSGIPRPKFLT